MDEPAQNTLLPPTEEVKLHLFKLLEKSLVTRLSHQASQQTASPPVSMMQEQIDEDALRSATERFKKSGFGQLPPLRVGQRVDQFRDSSRTLHFGYKRLKRIAVICLSREVKNLLFFSFEAGQG